MTRPTQLDWLVYKFFKWWWDPILMSRPVLILGIILELRRWMIEAGYPIDEYLQERINEDSK